MQRSNRVNAVIEIGGLIYARFDHTALHGKRGMDGIIEPDDLAEIYWQLHQQPRSAWSFEIDARPFSEPW